MPVTFRPAQHQAAQVPFIKRADSNSDTRALILNGACPKQRGENPGEIFQSSFDHKSDKDKDVHPRNNGFVDSVVQAYGQHHALVIRPDDVWLAILVQFNFYVNGHAEDLRTKFVAHKGQKMLVVHATGDRYTVNMGQMVKTFTRLIQRNVVDPSLRSWILPKFSTTTPNDTVVCSVVMMATLKAYFKYVSCITCGIPQVTLEGTKADWQRILKRLDKLKEYGVEAIAWYHLLVPIITQFVRAFDDPNSLENQNFWNKVVSQTAAGCAGEIDLTGWITAFCVFDVDGKWAPYPRFYVDPKTAIDGDPVALSANDFMTTYFGGNVYGRGPSGKFDWYNGGAYFLHLELEDVASGFAEVPILLVDNGVKIESTMIAGHVGSRVCSSGDKALSKDGRNDTLKPVAGWWIFKKTGGKVGKVERDDPDLKVPEGGRDDMDVGDGNSDDEYSYDDHAPSSSTGAGPRHKQGNLKQRLLGCICQ